MPANIHTVIVVNVAESKTNSHKLNGNGLNSKSIFSLKGRGLGTKNFRHVNVQNLDMSTNLDFVWSIQREQNDTSTLLVYNHLSAPPVIVLFDHTVPHLSLSSDVYVSHVMFNRVATSLNILHSTPYDKPAISKYHLGILL